MTVPAAITMTVVRNLNKTGFSLLILCILCGLVIVLTAMADDILRIDAEVLKKAEEKCGKDAPVRLIAWEDLVRQEQGKPELEKLNKVNLFFNRLPYAEDIDIWGVQDYWATPVEFLCKGTGDCEEYAIAKYFTLKALGVSEEKLKITYVKAIQLNRSHMVLAYYGKPGDEPLILDNLISSIKSSSQRNDLLPIFSFNGSGLWMAQQRGRERKTTDTRLKKWDDLLKKMSGNSL
jgi:predicted transglutaminase-like cysteine proteinase